MTPFSSTPAAGGDLLRLSATELLAAYAAGAISPVEVAEAVFAAVEATNDRLRAYLAVNVEDGMQAAREAERRWLAGEPTPPLCGVPVSVKDSIEMAGLPTTYGSLAFRDNVQPDAVMVSRLRAAGAVLVGKTNLPEFALCPETANRLGPPTRNPWDLSRSAGGSSGGAAAAVAAGLGPIAIGTDSGGSIRCPASYNGVFGLKPTYQRIPSVQRWRAAAGRSHNGPITRTVADAVLLMRVLAQPHPLDPESQLPVPDYAAHRNGTLVGRRVAVAASHAEAESTEAVREVVRRAIAVFEELGCELVDATPPTFSPYVADDGAWPYAGDHYAAAESLRPGFWEAHHDELTPYARPIYDSGRKLLAWQYRAALRHDQRYRDEVRAWFERERIDLVVMQGTGVAPPVDTSEGGTGRARLRDLVAFNIARNPAGSVPAGFDPETGLPVAVQVIGRYGDDVGVLRAAAALEQAQPWADRWPDLTLVAAS